MKLHTFPEEFQELITIAANDKHILESAVERGYFGAKVVMKNNEPEKILLSPDGDVKLTDKVYDAHLLVLASTRMNHFDPSQLVSQSTVDAEFGFTREKLAEIEEIQFE